MQCVVIGQQFPCFVPFTVYGRTVEKMVVYSCKLQVWWLAVLLDGPIFGLWLSLVCFLLYYLLIFILFIYISFLFGSFL